MRQQIADRIDKFISPEPMSGCWLWSGAIGSHGYGCFRNPGKNNGTTLAHRAVFELFSGPIPYGMVLDHKCLNIKCVNPAHLRVCTPEENQHFRRKATCIHGHNDWTVWPSRLNTRACRSCARINAAKFRTENRKAAHFA